jgi:pimeloyl-ACP methyl ester carboxylesterase
VNRQSSPIGSRRHFLSAAVGMALSITVFRCVLTREKSTAWQLSTRAQVAVLGTEFGPVVYFVPRDPRRVVVLAHGYPWPDGWLFGPLLLEYVRRAARRWVSFAQANAALILAPAMGAGDFAGYREMVGHRIDASDYVNTLVDRAAKPLIPDFDGRFALHGHSAGGQFAARYLVVHPARLTQAILSAASSYPFPDSSIAWPDGMAPSVRGRSSGRRAGNLFAADPGGWLQAASQVPVTVLVGSRDTQPRPSSRTQPGRTRIDRAKAWVNAMKRLAESNGKTATVKLLIAPGLDHDEAAMASPAQRILSGEYAGS